MDDVGNRNPLAQSATTVGVRRAYGFGISSTGMYMRDFLYLGFNEDESARQVFDAVRILIPGTHRLMANVEFSDPNVYSRQDQHADFTSYSYPPLTYAVTTDPVSGLRDGILKRPETDPLVFHVDTANEFWQMNASLNVHDGRGEPVPIPDNVRLYYLANHSHVGASGVAARPTDTGWNLRAPGPRGMDLCGLSGAFIAFVETRADRLASGDPRRSLQERYGDHAGFVAAVERAAAALVGQRFLLAEDAEVIIGLAEESDILTARGESPASHRDR